MIKANGTVTERCMKIKANSLRSIKPDSNEVAEECIMLQER